MNRLSPSDPNCITDNPSLVRVDLGRHSPEDDPRRVEAREQHGRYHLATQSLAPSPGEALDSLETRVFRGEVRVVRQVLPGQYVFARSDGRVFDLGRGRLDAGAVEQNRPKARGLTRGAT